MLRLSLFAAVLAVASAFQTPPTRLPIRLASRPSTRVPFNTRLFIKPPSEFYEEKSYGLVGTVLRQVGAMPLQDLGGSRVWLGRADLMGSTPHIRRRGPPPASHCPRSRRAGAHTSSLTT